MDRAFISSDKGRGEQHRLVRMRQVTIAIGSGKVIGFARGC